MWHFIGGKPITPNDINDSLLNGKRQVNGHPPENGALAETVTKTEVFHIHLSLASIEVVH